jgi:hypothetical protein
MKLFLEAEQQPDQLGESYRLDHVTSSLVVVLTNELSAGGSAQGLTAVAPYKPAYSERHRHHHHNESLFESGSDNREEIHGVLMLSEKCRTNLGFKFQSRRGDRGRGRPKPEQDVVPARFGESNAMRANPIVCAA